MAEERRALPAFALEDYYLNKKVEEANKKAELFKMAGNMIEHITRIDNPESIKKILDAFDEHRKEVEKNAPHCDYRPDENCPGLWKKKS